MNEVKQLRTQFSKTFELPDGKFNLKSYLYPVHYKTDENEFEEIDTTVENGSVTKTCYIGSALTNEIGYSIISKKDGSRIDVKLLTADNKNIPYKQSRYENNKVIWEDVDTDLDIIIEFRPQWIRLWKKLKTDKAPTNFKFTVIVDKGDGKDTKLREGIMGYDNNNTPVKLIHNKNLKREYESENGKEIIEYEVENIFEKKTIVRDKETRKKSLSDEVSYPVMIDVDVNVGIALSADDGFDAKATGVATTSSLNITGSVVNILNYSFSASSFQKKQAFLRFDGITIPQSSTIDSATLGIFYTAPNGTINSVKGYAFDENDPNAPTAPGAIINKTAGIASNNITRNFASATAFTLVSPDVKLIVQELVNSFAYSSQAMMFFFRAPAQTVSVNLSVRFYAYDQGTTKDAQLDITYTAPAGGWPHDIAGVANANVGKIGGVDIGNVEKVAGVS